jgi:hypothetical protein
MSTPYDPPNPDEPTGPPQYPAGYPGQAPGYPGQQGQYPPGQYPPGYPGAPQQRPPSERKGLAITSLVLGIVAVLGCWIPFLNIGSVVLGLAGLVLGIVALVQASKGAAGGQVMAIIGAALSTLAIIVAIVVNVFFVAYLDDQSPAFQEELEQQLEELEEQY